MRFVALFWNGVSPDGLLLPWQPQNIQYSTKISRVRIFYKRKRYFTIRSN